MTSIVPEAASSHASSSWALMAQTLKARFSKAQFPKAQFPKAQFPKAQFPKVFIAALMLLTLLPCAARADYPWSNIPIVTGPNSFSTKFGASYYLANLFVFGVASVDGKVYYTSTAPNLRWSGAFLKVPSTSSGTGDISTSHPISSAVLKVGTTINALFIGFTDASGHPYFQTLTNHTWGNVTAVPGTKTTNYGPSLIQYGSLLYYFVLDSSSGRPYYQTYNASTGLWSGTWVQVYTGVAHIDNGELSACVYGYDGLLKLLETYSSGGQTQDVISFDGTTWTAASLVNTRPQTGTSGSIVCSVDGDCLYYDFTDASTGLSVYYTLINGVWSTTLQQHGQVALSSDPCDVLADQVPLTITYYASNVPAFAIYTGKS